MKLSEKICFMILTGISIFLIGIFDAKALDINELKDFTQLQFNSDFDATEFWNTDQDAVAVFTKTFNIGTYDNGADYIVYQGFIDLFSYKSTKTNTMDPTYIKYATKVYLTTQDNEIIICENNMTESGYIICRNPKKMVNTISFFTSFNTLGTALDDNYYYKVHLYRTFWYANKSETDNTTIANNTTDIKNKMNEDIDNDSKTAPNQTEYDNAKQQENTIISGISGASPNDITFTQDINATGTIWNLIDNIVNTNAKIIGLIISILSIGLIKLILAR